MTPLKVGQIAALHRRPVGKLFLRPAPCFGTKLAPCKTETEQGPKRVKYMNLKGTCASRRRAYQGCDLGMNTKSFGRCSLESPWVVMGLVQIVQTVVPAKRTGNPTRADTAQESWCKPLRAKEK